MLFLGHFVEFIGPVVMLNTTKHNVTGSARRDGKQRLVKRNDGIPGEGVIKLCKTPVLLHVDARGAPDGVHIAVENLVRMTWIVFRDRRWTLDVVRSHAQPTYESVVEHITISFYAVVGKPPVSVQVSVLWLRLCFGYL